MELIDAKINVDFDKRNNWHHGNLIDIYKVNMIKIDKILTPVVNFINILWAAFVQIFFYQKITKPL